ncbi:MAG: hypothetical protein QXW38_08335 [Candidatus Nitrosotenuis sp.]
MKVKFQSDKVYIRGPKVDGSYQVAFEIGEYQRPNIKDLVTVQDKVLNITVEATEDE